MTEFALTIGTRPEIIKMAPVIREIKKRGYNPLLIHTGQHNLDSLMKDLELPDFDIVLDKPPETAGKFAGSLTKGITKASHWTVNIARKIRKICKDRDVESLLFQGDTLAIASASVGGRLMKNRPVLGHVEAGIRTHDLFNPFPEELSRKIADRTSDLLFAPTQEAVNNLNNEKRKGKIFLTGNTIVDAAQQHQKMSNGIKLNVPKNYGICFVHRQENVHSKESIENLHKLLKNVEENVVLLKHPTFMNQLNGSEKKFRDLDNVYFKDFFDYLPFLKLTKNSQYVVTDSGGMQEESSILKFPCLVWRTKTERPEALRAGTAQLVGNDWKKAIEHIEDYKNKGDFYKNVKNSDNPFGDGKASKRIVDAILDEISKR